MQAFFSFQTGFFRSIEDGGYSLAKPTPSPARLRSGSSIEDGGYSLAKPTPSPARLRSGSSIEDGGYSLAKPTPSPARLRSGSSIEDGGYSAKPTPSPGCVQAAVSAVLSRGKTPGRTTKHLVQPQNRNFLRNVEIRSSLAFIMELRICTWQDSDRAYLPCAQAISPQTTFSTWHMNFMRSNLLSWW
jgi:hypothetical protein